MRLVALSAAVLLLAGCAHPPHAPPAPAEGQSSASSAPAPAPLAAAPAPAPAPGPRTANVSFDLGSGLVSTCAVPGQGCQQVLTPPYKWFHVFAGDGAEGPAVTAVRLTVAEASPQLVPTPAPSVVLRCVTSDAFPQGPWHRCAEQPQDLKTVPFSGKEVEVALDGLYVQAPNALEVAVEGVTVRDDTNLGSTALYHVAGTVTSAPA